MFRLRICVSICLYSGHFLKSNLSGPAVKRGPGRPPGTGPKQIAARLAQAQGDTAMSEKRPVGRPRKNPQVDAKSVGVRVDGPTVCAHSCFM